MVHQLAEVNIARMRGTLDEPSMAPFVALLDEINALADAAPGFVWRFQEANGNATYVRPYDDDRILFNLSVWESIESLRRFSYGSAHAGVLVRRHEWFERMDRLSLALWWIPAGHRPSIDEAKERLAFLQANGPSDFAFTFKTPLPPPDSA